MARSPLSRRGDGSTKITRFTPAYASKKRWSTPSRLVRVEMIEENDFCTILVYDQGPGFVLEQVPFPNGAAQRGRGICLIRHCMDEVIYDTERHCLVMKIRRKTHNKGVRDHE